MKRVLLAGATGYLGRHVAKELLARGYGVRAIARHPETLQQVGFGGIEIFTAEVTQPESLTGCCDNIDVVISTVGITRQKDGLTYMDVDYQANMNVLRQAAQSGVEKFVYVSVLNGEALRHLKICNAKEMFVDRLKQSGMDYGVIRPNGFFSDMAEFYEMAQKGRIYLFGDGNQRANPIHGRDLATVCVDAIDRPDREINVGGPETLTHNEIAMTAFDVLDRKPKITRIPGWVNTIILKLIRSFTSSKTYGPIEFFMTVMAMDMLAPEYGQETIRAYFTDLRHRVGK